MQHQRGVVQKMHFEDVTQQIIYGNALHHILITLHVTLALGKAHGKQSYMFC